MEVEEFNLVKYLKPALHPEVWGFAFIFLSVVSNDDNDEKPFVIAFSLDWSNIILSCTTTVMYAFACEYLHLEKKKTEELLEYIKLTRTDFLPIILRENLNFSLAASQCLIAPPYAFAAILMFATAWVGDRFRVRGVIIVVNSLIGLIGLPIMAFPPNPSVRYFGVFLAVGGTNSNIPATMAYQVKTNQSWNLLS